ncbi:hypothetical protein MDA_GLEAN10010547 [Myotis davidii]|uniref:Uncharacterized protein n=1 Tax=Myotis davidii TaxID=225400 RepID=L5LGG3_MYODS|nr:hypothetical protein MDA_GLEAN10010547 [Myotis davidii]
MCPGCGLYPQGSGTTHTHTAAWEEASSLHLCCAALPGSPQPLGAQGEGTSSNHLAWVAKVCSSLARNPKSPAGPPTDAQTKSLAIQTLDSVMAQAFEEEPLQILHIPHVARTLRYCEGLHQPHHGAHNQAWSFAAWIWGRGLLTWDVGFSG